MFTGRKPLFEETGYKLYDGNAIPGLDCCSTATLRRGNFLQAAVHTWRFEEVVSNIEIGKYAEPLREFLHDGTDLPPQVAISIGIASDVPRFLGCFPPIPMQDPNGNTSSSTYLE